MATMPKTKKKSKSKLVLNPRFKTGRHVEFVDAEGKARVGKVKSRRGNVATLELASGRRVRVPFLRQQSSLAVVRGVYYRRKLLPLFVEDSEQDKVAKLPHGDTNR